MSVVITNELQVRFTYGSPQHTFLVRPGLQNWMRWQEVSSENVVSIGWHLAKSWTPYVLAPGQNPLVNVDLLGTANMSILSGQP